MTLLQRDGKEYPPHHGRLGHDRLAWSDCARRLGTIETGSELAWLLQQAQLCSGSNRWAAVTQWQDIFFEKMNASEKEGVNDRGSRNSHNEVLYGIKAYKSYFLLGDYMVALGCGRNQQTAMAARTHPHNH